jgi:hypothetical protein
MSTYSNRTYDRDTVTWELSDLQALAALDPPQAVFYEKVDRWVVRQPGGPSYAVRPEQIVDSTVNLDDQPAAPAVPNIDPLPLRPAKAVTPDSSTDEVDDLVAFFTKYRPGSPRL